MDALLARIALEVIGMGLAFIIGLVVMRKTHNLDVALLTAIFAGRITVLLEQTIFYSIYG